MVESKYGDEGKAFESKGADSEDEGAPHDVTLRFMIQPEGFPHLMTVPRAATLSEVKAGVAADLQLPAGAVVLSGAGLESAADLMHLKAGVEYDVILTIRRDVAEAASAFKLPSRLDVVVHFDDEDVPSRTISVAIEREEAALRKRFLGGFRSTKTGVEYHHASTYRAAEPSAARLAEEAAKPVKLTRTTQTQILVSRSAQSTRESGTQMARPDLQLDASRDRVVAPKPYFDSAQLHLLRVRSTLTLQRYWRGFAARRRAAGARRARAERAAEQQAVRERRAAEERDRHAREVERRMNPTSRSDFEVLYNELDNWRQHETQRIKATPGIADKERQAQLEELLAKETKLLQTIDKLKLLANDLNRKKKIDKMLADMSAPKEWQMRDGDLTLVHTPFTTRAKELRDLYAGLTQQGLSVDERLDVLLHVKWTAKEFDCDLTRDIVDLVDREADLLNRGRSDKAMAGLRKRIATLFLQFIETPDFNPEAARFQHVPRELVIRPQVVPK